MKYVRQPRLENIDQPVDNDLSAYCDRLGDALKNQILEAQEGTKFPVELHDSIKKYSWTGLVDHLWHTIQ